MSRRQRDGEIGFGSDSFLDIIANIVGILIILIVVAGVRVSNAPLLDVADERDEADEAVPVAALDPDPAPDEPAESSLPVPAFVEAEVLPPEPVDAPPRAPVVYVEAPAPEVSPELAAKVARLRRALADSSTESRRTSAERAALERELAEARRQLAVKQREADERAQRVAATAREVKRLAEDLQRENGLVIALRKETEEEAAREPDVETIAHRLTAVSRVVESEEIHFRLAGNRVAPIPLDELLDRLKRQVERQRDWLTKFKSHQGLVGPVEGFQMKYVVQRQQLSTVDRLRGGAGIVRIGLSRWELEPTRELRAETYEEALAGGSRFRRAIGVVDGDTTLTFWVYPDSFELFRALQSALQQNGFTVAGRPLPEGVPIAGSPNGSRSSGQ